MDSLTHIVLGACIGEIFIGRKTGRRALLLGAVAQSIPDIDFVTSFWMPASDNLIAHRGFTHSILFVVLMTPLLSWLADKWRRPHDVAFKTWLLFFGSELFCHLALDTANAYGTGWLEPFSHQRFSYHTLFVADPLFSIVPGIATVLLVFFRRHRRRKHWAAFSIGWCAVYLGLSLSNKAIIEGEIASVTQAQNIKYRRHFTTPTPLNNLLWYVVLEDDKGYYTGYRSVFDDPRKQDLHYFPRNDSLLLAVQDLDELRQLLRFSQGYYTIEKWHDSLVFNDLRFGQMSGWNDPNAGFVFHYFLKQPRSNDMVIQRGRFAGWNKAVIMSMLRRIKGT